MKKLIIPGILGILCILLVAAIPFKPRGNIEGNRYVYDNVTNTSTLTNFWNITGFAQINNQHYVTVDDGNDIQTKINLGENQIIIPCGEYLITSKIQINYSNLSIVGSGDCTNIKLNDSVNQDMIQLNNVNHVIIRDLRLDGNGGNQGANGDCVKLTNSNYNTIESLTLIDCAGDGIDIEANSDYNTITNNYFYNVTARDNYGLGIVSRNNKYNEISYNIIEDSINRDGIGASNTYGIKYTGNRIINCNLYGLSVYNSTESVISGNYVRNCNSGGIISDINSSKTRIIDNTVNGGDNGIRVYQNSNGTAVKDNTITGATNGIHIWNSRNVGVSDNTVLGNNQRGIYLQDAYYTVVSDNKVFNNNASGILSSSSNDNLYTGNDVYMHTTNIQIVGSNEVSFNNFDNLTTYFKGDIDLTDNDVDIILKNNQGRIEATSTGGTVNSLLWYDSADYTMLRGQDNGIKFQKGTSTISTITSTGILLTNGKKLCLDDSTCSNYLMNGTITIPLNWANLQVYPSACPGGSFVTQLDDSVTCTTTSGFNGTCTNDTSITVSNGLITGCS